jgi:fluoroacetyl-CoA thioesterase
MPQPLEPGLTGTVSLTVTSADTAQALGSGDVPVLGTPRVVALVEEATVAAVGPALSPEQTTVGSRVELDHKAATPVGRAVLAEAVLTEVNGRKLTFEVTLTDAGALAAQGVVHRVLVDRQKFLDRL